MPDTQPLPAGHVIGPMRDDEVAVLTSWAAAEGWNPGANDVGIARALDPDAFIALRDGDEFIGGGTIFRVAPRLGFMGLFIVRSDRRSNGLGRVLWHHRRDLLLSRLESGSTIGMDGVFDMVPFYRRGGFELAYRDLRFEGTATGTPDPHVEPLDAFDCDEVYRLDASLLGADRRTFLEQWLTAPGVRAVGLRVDGRLAALGALRPALVGHKFGPVLAENPSLAERLIGHLMSTVRGEQVQLDVPEPNEPGLA
ncbi:MAG: GNAT family N-acetyltransferase, partial [Ilumatobacteraceae bacterium]